MAHKNRDYRDLTQDKHDIIMEEKSMQKYFNQLAKKEYRQNVS